MRGGVKMRDPGNEVDLTEACGSVTHERYLAALQVPNLKKKWREFRRNKKVLNFTMPSQFSIKEQHFKVTKENCCIVVFACVVLFCVHTFHCMRL